MPTADSWVVRREDGFTLVELVVVLVIIAILLTVAVGFQSAARERASDATAKANIRTAVPAIAAYRADNGTYVGMTQAGLKSQYSPGVSGIARRLDAGGRVLHPGGRRRELVVQARPERPGHPDGLLVAAAPTASVSRTSLNGGRAN